jgi:hypothetical protein
MHRDISIGNIMFWKDPAKWHISERHIHARLIDFDLASVTGDNTQHALRTGSAPFMACALLRSMGGKGIQHVYEHDVESFFWVAMCVLFHCRNEHLEPKCPLRQWDTISAESFARVKEKSFSKWFSCLRSSRDVNIRNEWKRWNPFFQVIEKFLKHNFSPTDDIDEVYEQLRMAKKAGEKALPRKK